MIRRLLPVILLIIVVLLAGCEEGLLSVNAQLYLWEGLVLDDDLTGLWVEDEGWAVGPLIPDTNDSRVLVLRGDKWKIASDPAGSLTDVVGDGAGGCYAVGAEGLLARYDGEDWSRYPNLTNEDLTAICSATDGLWAVGRNGVLLHFDGTTWSLDDSGTTEHLFGITETADGLLIVGAGGTVLLGDGSAWTSEDTGVTTSLLAVDRCGAGDEYVAVGDNGVILFRVDGEWTTVDSFSGTRFNGVSAPAAGYCLIVGESGVVVLVDQYQARLLDSPTTENLNGVTLAGLSDGWIVGDRGTILRYR
jgi:hypothetical protein